MGYLPTQAQLWFWSLVKLSLLLICQHSYIAQRAETDLTLSQSDCDSLRYTVKRPDRSAPPSRRIGRKLAFYSRVLKDLIENDEEIWEQDNEVIKHVCRAQGSEIEDGNQTDNPSQESSDFDFAAMRTHLLEIFAHLFSQEMIAKGRVNSSHQAVFVAFKI